MLVLAPIVWLGLWQGCAGAGTTPTEPPPAEPNWAGVFRGTRTLDKYGDPVVNGEDVELEIPTKAIVEALRAGGATSVAWESEDGQLLEIEITAEPREEEEDGS